MYARARVVLIAGVAVSLAILGYCLILLKDKRVEESFSSLAPIVADIQISDFTFVQTENGRNRWEIRAARAELFEDQRSAILTDLVVSLSMPEGMGMTLSGTRGSFDTVDRNFEIYPDGDDIEIVFNNGYTVLAESITWTDRDQMARSPDSVQIRGPGFRIDGQGLEASVAEQEVKVLSNVRATVF